MPEAKPDVQTGSQPAEQPASSGPESKEKRFVAVVGPDGVQHVEITGGEHYFEPNVILCLYLIEAVLGLGVLL